jgi:hypothetical protein
MKHLKIIHPMHAMTVYGKLGSYSYTISDPRHYTEVIGGIHAPTALSPEKGPKMPLGGFHCRSGDFGE